MAKTFALLAIIAAFAAGSVLTGVVVGYTHNVDIIRPFEAPSEAVIDKGDSASETADENLADDDDDMRNHPTTATQSGGASDNDNWNNVHGNVLTDFNPVVANPDIHDHAFVHPFGIVIGNCILGEMVFVAPTAVCRGDEGTPIHVGDYSNMQDGVVIHALETTSEGNPVDDRRFAEDGTRLKGDDTRFSDGYAVWVGDSVSLAHGVMLHGPAWVGDNSFIGMESLIFNARIGTNVAVGVSSTITGGVEIPDGKFVPPGSVITTQEQADSLPDRVGSPYEKTNDAVLHVNVNLAKGYDQMDLEKYVLLREAMMEEQMLETGTIVD